MGKKKKEKKQAGKLNLGHALSNIKTLKKSNRPKEAIAYEYMIFTMICGAKYSNARKHPSQSIREFAMDMVKQNSLDPSNVYPFIQNVEEVLYGGHAPSEEAYRQSTQLFGKVFEEIVGKPLPPL